MDTINPTSLSYSDIERKYAGCTEVSHKNFLFQLLIELVQKHKESMPQAERFDISMNSLLMLFKIKLHELEPEHKMLPVQDLTSLLKQVGDAMLTYPNVVSFNKETNQIILNLL